MLAISGNLNPTLYGPSVPVFLTDFMTGRGRPVSGPLDGDGRRSIYIRVQRNFLTPMLVTFDMPSPFSTMGRRNSSNVPAQSLILMNDPFVWQQARQWAERLLREWPDRDTRIEQLFLAAYSRPPRNGELDRVYEFLHDQATLHKLPSESLSVWTDLCHVIWNTKEFVYVY
jgi:hypothetical protein